MALMAWPHIKESLRKMARGIAAADPRTIITVMLAVSVLVAGGYALIRLSTMRRKSRKRMKTRGLRKNGALLVAYLSLLVIFFLPNQVFVDDVLPTSTLIHIPLYMNMRLLSRKADARTVESFDHWLCYWAVHAILDLIWRFPRVGIRARGISVFGKIRMLLGVWLGFPMFGGAELIIDALAPLIDNKFKRMPKNDLNKATRWILSALQFGNVVTPEKASEIKLALSDPGFVVAFAAVFLITPEIITRGACLFVELVSPIYASMYSYINEDISLKTKWLQFWVVSRLMLLILDQMRDLTSYIPLWTRLELLVSIWLQIPYFNGASRVYKELDTLFAKGRAIANRIGIFKKATVDNENNRASEPNDADEVAQVSEERKNQ
uniref:HVA22-like protein n=1 Tax=Rhodosorus marinus TaxID=101924 RepID=A0A7S2ZM56_9RHOD|mmetsp:Transcript_2456/g.10570  ORF Transcript_2456/g.10570 Transcript_2456/m.10570 type:complete len:379 (+) Transcript_2456:309-1445(+)